MATADVEAAVEELRSTFDGGKTKTFEWRASQLKALLKIATHHESEIVEALRSDLNKPELEACIHEVSEGQNHFILYLKSRIESR